MAMRILVMPDRRKARSYLVNLLTKSLIRKVCRLVSDQQYGEAITLVSETGIFEREIAREDFHATRADLILSDRSASWDATV